MRAIFMGTPELAVPTLEALVEVCRAQGGDVVGVVCQPDRPAGRGMHVSAPPVKVRAQALGLEVLQPIKVRDGALAAWMRERRPDVALVIAYGRILTREVLDVPRVGCLNVHASILPKFRGAAPIAWAILSGDGETGVDLMRMEEGLDTGPVLASARLPIDPDETAGELGMRVGLLAAQLVRASLIDAIDGKLEPKPQDDSKATLAPMLKKEDGLIDWRRPARALHDHVRGMQPWPGAVTTLPSGKTLKLVRTRVIEGRVAGGVARAPGTIVAADKGGALIACGPQASEALAIVEAQPEGKRAMGAADLVNGRVIALGAILGARVRSGADEA